MSECDNIRPQLTAMLDNELTPVGVSVIEIHLRECAGCSKTLTEYLALRSGIDSSSVPNRIDFWTRISDEIFDEAEPNIVADIHLMRQEMQVLREELAALRREFEKRQPSRSSHLSLPDAPARSFDPYRLV